MSISVDIEKNLGSFHLRVAFEAENETMALLAEQGLEKYKDDIATSLPYGIQRRLEIARALATSPDFLLLDEPAAGMNPQESTELMRFIRHIRDEFDLTILLIEHIMKAVVSLCEKVIVLHHGEKIAEGTPEQVMNDPYVMEVYLGTKKEGASA